MSDKNILIEGVAMYNRRDYGGALTFFLSLPEESVTDNIELAYYIGLCYLKLERYDDALLYLEQVVTAGNGTERVLQCRYLLALIYVRSGRKKLASFELNKLIENGYKPAAVYSSLAYIAWQEEQVELCLDYYKKALEEDEDCPTALNGMGYVLASENRDLTKALSYCKKALSIEPDSAACLDSVGWVYVKLGLMNDAMKYLSQAHEILPDNELINEHIRMAQEV